MDKDIAKKTLIYTLALLITTFVISLMSVFSITLAGKSSLDLSYGQLVLLCLGTAIVPTGLFVGFFSAFSKVTRVTKPLFFALSILFPITLVIILIYGIISIVPMIVKCIIILKKG